jgi:hypothetical protein
MGQALQDIAMLRPSDVTLMSLELPSFEYQIDCTIYKAPRRAKHIRIKAQSFTKVTTSQE